MAKRRKNPDRHPGVLRLLEEARRVGASDSAPRKHHLVPKSYLARWAERGQIRVTDVRQGCDYTTSPERAAKETDFYSVASTDLDADVLPPMLFEVLLSKIEAWGVEGIDHLLSEPDEPDPEVLARLCWHLGMTLTRGNATRQRLRRMAEETFRLQYGDLGADAVRAMLRRSGEEPSDALVSESFALVEEIRDGTVVASPQEAALVGLAAQSAVDLGEELLHRTWTIFRTPSVLLTCDEPVVLIGGPGFRRDERAGLREAGTVVFPLSPSAALVMFRPDVARRLGNPSNPLPIGDLDHLQVGELNREIAMHCYRWVFERPAKRVAARLWIPSDPGTTVVEVRPDIELISGEGDVIRVYGKTRWQGALAATPWPIQAWWS